MAESRQCARCGTTFEPKREHARFCSARCRVAWNRENWNRENRQQPRWGTENWAQGNAAGQGSPESALGWAIIAMRDVTERIIVASKGRFDRAVGVLREAYDAGFDPFERIASDQAMASLRSTTASDSSRWPQGSGKRS